jgi:hypothetical protein
MIRYFACFLLVSLLSLNSFAEEPRAEEGFESIFNGKDLAGWEGDSRLWSVKDGAIRGETTAENKATGNTFLIWQEGKLKDFELRLSFRCNAANNSGIQYRSRHITEGNPRNKWVVRGYQHEIRNENKLPSVSGFIYDEGGQRGRMALVGDKTTWSADGEKTIADEKLIDGQGFQELFKLDDWNDVIIIAKGNHLQHYMNGKLIMDCTDKDPRGSKEGILAVQLHAGSPMWVEYKNVRVKHLK